MYWYNFAEKDNVHGASAPTNTLYKYEVRIKGIDGILPLEPNPETGIYPKEDSVLGGTWPNKCASRWKTGTVTALVSPQMVCVDGMPRHVRDLRSFPYVVNNPVEDEIPASGDDEIYITVSNNGDGDDHLIYANLGGSSNGNDNKGQQLTIEPFQIADEPAVPRLRRNDWRKRPFHSCNLCNDDETREECSGDSRSPAPNDIDSPAPWFLDDVMPIRAVVFCRPSEKRRETLEPEGSEQTIGWLKMSILLVSFVDYECKSSGNSIISLAKLAKFFFIK